MNTSSNDPAQRLLSRLREDAAARGELITLGIDAIAQRPLRAAAPAPWLARSLHAALVATASAPDLSDWIEGHLTRAMARAQQVRGTLGDHVPMTVMLPVERALRREFPPDPRLVRLFLDHPSFRALAASVLQAQLSDFARRLKTMVPAKTKPNTGRGLASAFAGVAKGVASAVSSEVERQLDDRVHAFVRETIGKVVEGTVDHLCDPSRADEMGQWRVDVLRGLMTYPLDALVNERHKYPPQAMARDLSDLIAALGQWKQLASHLERFVDEAYEDWGDMTIEAFLAGSGLETRWREDLAELLDDHLAYVARQDAFEAWVRDALAPPEG